MSKHCAILTYNSFTELNPVIKPVGEPFANWQWKTRLGGGRFCLVGVVIIWVGCCCCWWVGWWCKSLPLKLTPLVGEFDFVFLLNNGMMLLMWCIFRLNADRAKELFSQTINFLILSRKSSLLLCNFDSFWTSYLCSFYMIEWENSAEFISAHWEQAIDQLWIFLITFFRTQFDRLLFFSRTSIFSLHTVN